MNIKTEAEIDCMRKAGLILQKAQAAMRAMIKPGVQLDAIDKVAEEVIRAAGGVPGFFGYQGGKPSHFALLRWKRL